MTKIVLMGGSGRTGVQLLPLLKDRGHDVHVASPSTGVDALTGAGLDTAFEGMEVVIDVMNPTTHGGSDVMHFFTTIATNSLRAAERARVRHVVLLSVVGADLMPGSAYMQAKARQEQLYRHSSVGFTIVRATQFFEFVATFGDAFMSNGEVVVPDAMMQPIALADVATALASVAESAPLNNLMELGGPEPLAIREAVERLLKGRGDRRAVRSDASVTYFGAQLARDTLLPASNVSIGTTTLDSWLGQR